MPQLTVTAAPIRLQAEGNPSPINGRNNSAVPIYLSELPDVSQAINQGVIGPNGTFSWPAGKALYAATGPNGTASVTYSNNGSVIHDGNVSSDTLNTIDLIATIPIVYAAAAGTYPITSPYIDVSSYASVLIKIITGSGFTAAPLTNYIDLGCVFRGVALYGSQISQIYQPQFPLQPITPFSTGAQNFQIPVKDRFLDIQATIFKAVTPAASNSGAVIQVYGSNEVVSSPIYTNKPQLLALPTNLTNRGVYRLQQAAATVLAATDIQSVNGDAFITNYVTAGAAAATVILTALISGAAVQIYRDSSLASNAVTNLPMFPIQVAYTTGAASPADLTIRQDMK